MTGKQTVAMDRNLRAFGRTQCVPTPVRRTQRHRAGRLLSTAGTIASLRPRSGRPRTTAIRGAGAGVASDRRRTQRAMRPQALVAPNARRLRQLAIGQGNIR